MIFVSGDEDGFIVYEVGADCHGKVLRKFPENLVIPVHTKILGIFKIVREEDELG